MIGVCAECDGRGVVKTKIAGVTTVGTCPKCDGQGEIDMQIVKTQSDAVQHPQHYNEGKYEVIDVIEDWKLGFNDGNAVKYIGRHRHKNRPAEDLKKALWYIARELVTAHHVATNELAQVMLTIVKTDHTESDKKN